MTVIEIEEVDKRDRDPVEVVVVSYNTREHLVRCVGALSVGSLRVIVVDNASSDGSTAMLRQHFRDVQVVSRPENGGFGAAANEGLRCVRSTYALLLNADAWPCPGALGRLVSVAEQDPHIAVVAPRLLNENGMVQRSVFGYPMSAISLTSWMLAPTLISNAFVLWRLLGRLVRGHRHTAGTIPRNDFPAGAALLLRMSAFDEVGGFDEAFFMYSEETDLCERLRASGWKICFAPGATVVHVGGASSRQAAEFNEREQLRSYLRFLAKHRGAAEAGRAFVLLKLVFNLRSFGLSRAKARRMAAWLSATDLASLLA